MSYHEKYLKYKKKYLDLARQKGGTISCNNDRVFKNILGTCWMIAIQTIFCFGDTTKDNFENIMENFSKNIYIDYIQKKDIVKNLIRRVMENKKLSNVFPEDIFNPDNSKYLEKILEKIIDRYLSKIFAIGQEKKPKNINLNNNPERCELLISTNYNILFENITLKNLGDRDSSENINRRGNIIDVYVFANLLSIFFLGYKISFRQYYPYYKSDFEYIKYNFKEDIGVLLSTSNHMCCFFICNGVQKYYNDNDKKIFDCDWISLLEKINNETCLYIQSDGYVLLLDKENYQKHEEKYNLDKVLYFTVVSKNGIGKMDEIDNILHNRNLDMINDRLLNNILGESTSDIKYFRKAAESGSSDALVTLGNMLGDINILESISYYSNAFEMENYEAAYELGQIYENGKDEVEPDINKAIKYYTAAAENPNVYRFDSFYKLGQIYENGKDEVEPDIDKALKYYEIVANSNSPDASYASYILGDLYEDIDDDINNNYKIKAIKYYKKAATDYPDSLYKIGNIYEYLEDITNAIKFYKISAEKEYLNAAVKLESIYKNGVNKGGVIIEKNNDIARKYYYHQYYIKGKIYETGDGQTHGHDEVKKDINKAIQLYKLAEDHVKALFRLSRIYGDIKYKI